MGLSPWCGKGFLKESVFPSFLRCPYNPCMESHRSTSVCMLKSQTFTAIPLFGCRTILHTLIGMGSAALVAAVPYPWGSLTPDQNFPQETVKTTKQQQNKTHTKWCKLNSELEGKQNKQKIDSPLCVLGLLVVMHEPKSNRKFMIRLHWEGRKKHLFVFFYIF